MYTVKPKDMVIPGQLLAEDQRAGSGVVKEANKLYATVKGQARIDGQEIRVIPMQGTYLPKSGDVVIGVVVDIHPGAWRLDINCPYAAFMRGEECTENAISTDLSKFYDVGDILSAKVDRVNEVYDANVIKPRKLEDGLIVSIIPKRIPRVVGKKKSMLDVLRNKTGCKIAVGQNGLVWVKGERTALAVAALKKIEAEAHIGGLTDRIASFIDDQRKNT